MGEEVTPIYSGKYEDFHWAGFGSGSGTNLRECARVIKPALVVCDKPKAGLLDLEELTGVPRIVINGYEMCGSWKRAQGDPIARAHYMDRSRELNELLNERIKEFEKREGYSIDLVVLGGYMRIVMDPLLEVFRDRMINVHPGDLTILDEGKRVLIGDDAVYEAIRRGYLYTQSSVIIVDSGTDHGEILTRGPRVEAPWEIKVCDDNELQREWAKGQQDTQKRESDWRALTTALELIARGRLALGNETVFHNQWRRVYLDGKPLPYGGFQVKEQ